MYCVQCIHIMSVTLFARFSCCLVDCGPPPRVENGFAIRGGTSVFYVCNIGYDLDGPSSIVCNKDNRMWQMPPMCKQRQ